jgi:hypothetical protein
MVTTPGEELREALEQAVTHLVGVVYHAGEQVSMRVCVDKREGQVAEAREGIDAQVADRLVRKPVGAVAREPLRYCGAHNHKRKLLEEGYQRGKVHVSGRDHAIDRTANHDGHIELEHHRDGRCNEGGNQATRDAGGCRQADAA